MRSPAISKVEEEKKSLRDERLKCVGCRTKSKRGWIGFHHGHRHSVCYTNAKVLLSDCWTFCRRVHGNPGVFFMCWCLWVNERLVDGIATMSFNRSRNFIFFLSSFLFVFPFSPIDYSLIGNYTVIAMGVYYPHAPLYATTRFLSTPPSSFLLKITFADCFDTKEVVCNISPYFVHISLIGFKFLYCL